MGVIAWCSRRQTWRKPRNSRSNMTGSVLRTRLTAQSAMILARMLFSRACWCACYYTDYNAWYLRQVACSERVVKWLEV